MTSPCPLSRPPPPGWVIASSLHRWLWYKLIHSFHGPLSLPAKCQMGLLGAATCSHRSLQATWVPLVSAPPISVQSSVMILFIYFFQHNDFKAQALYPTDTCFLSLCASICISMNWGGGFKPKMKLSLEGTEHSAWPTQRQGGVLRLFVCLVASQGWDSLTGSLSYVTQGVASRRK